MKYFKKKNIGLWISYLTLIILGLFAVTPFIWQVSTSFKTLPDLMQNSTSILPKEFTLKNYITVIKTVGFLTFLKNSLIVSLSATAVGMVLSCTCAYAIVRFYPKFAKRITQGLIACYLFPSILLVVPYFVFFSNIHMTNNLFGLAIVYLSFSIPYSTWMLTGYFSSIPYSIEEAALIDGATKWQTFSKIAIPLTMPGIVATAIFAFINAWNEFLYSLVLISSGQKKTVSVALYSLVGGETIRYGEMMAASVLVVLPSIIFFFIIQKRLVGGLTGGAVK